jgi:hypothetical protein
MESNNLIDIYQIDECLDETESLVVVRCVFVELLEDKRIEDTLE